MKENRQSKQAWMLPLVMATVSVVSILVGMQLKESLVRDGYLEEPLQDESEAIFEAARHIQSKYYGDLDESKFTDAAISGMVKQLDPYSRYFQKSTDELYDRYINGLYRGIGVSFRRYNDQYFVFDVLPDSPASLAGIQKGERLMNLDGKELNIATASIDSLLRLSEKTIGDTIYLETVRSESETRKTYNILVDDVQIPLLQDFKIQTSQDGLLISYLKIDRFHNDVFREVMEVLERHKVDKGRIEYLILDVRDNPGGVVEETVKLLNQLIPEKNKLLLSTRSRNDIPKKYFTNGRSFIQIDRIVVVCNDQSASASEILAGVLQDYDRAVLTGTPTYGKGLIQQNYDLSNDASLNLSVGEYILPSGRSINKFSSSSDTLFQTLVNQRTLKNGRGLNMDITHEGCDHLRAIRDLSVRTILKHRLWTNIPDAGQLKAYYEEENGDTFTNDCYEWSYNIFQWYVMTEIIENGSGIDSEFIDPVLKKSVEVIAGPEYDLLLGYSD